jgi:hypothetical protein
MDNEIKNLLPRNISDIENAKAITDLGYPAVASVLPELFKWIQDINWPVAYIIAPFLATLGKPIVPDVRRILKTDDGVWKLWVLEYVVKNSQKEVIADLHDDLVRIITNPTKDEIVEGVVEQAEEILS